MSADTPKTTDLVPVPRSVARQALLDLMCTISEEDWCAGWMDGNEDGVFAAIVGHESGKNWPAAHRLRGSLITLAIALGEWPDPGDDWVPLAKMEAKWGEINVNAG